METVEIIPVDPLGVVLDYSYISPTLETVRNLQIFHPSGRCYLTLYNKLLLVIFVRSIPDSSFIQRARLILLSSVQLLAIFFPENK